MEEIFTSNPRVVDEKYKNRAITRCIEHLKILQATLITLLLPIYVVDGHRVTIHLQNFVMPIFQMDI